MILQNETTIRGHFFIQALGRVRQANPLYCVVRGVGFVTTVQRSDIKCDVNFDFSTAPWNVGGPPNLQLDGIWFLMPAAPEDMRDTMSPVKAHAGVGVFKDYSVLEGIGTLLDCQGKAVGAARIGLEILDFLKPIESMTDKVEKWLKLQEERQQIEATKAQACRSALATITAVLSSSEPVGVWRCREDHPLLH